MTDRGEAAYNSARDSAKVERLLRKQVIRYARLAAGTALILFGAVGGFIPILQGWVFVLAGLTLMAPESRRAKRLLDWAKTKVGGPGKAVGAGSVASDPGCGPREKGD